MSALHLRSAPATVIFSLIITFAWLVSVVTMQVVTRTAPAMAGPAVVAGRAARFVRARAAAHVRRGAPFGQGVRAQACAVKSDFIGRTCTVRTGSVSTKFGEATLQDGGAGLVLAHPHRDGKQLGRGEQALIVDY
jgi:hypothetical protein